MATIDFFALTFGVVGFVFGITALAKLSYLEKRLEKLEASRG